MNFSSLQFFLVCLVLKHISALKKCDTIDRCTCLTDEGKISLWELARRDGVPRFANIKCTSLLDCSANWNPCYSFSLPEPNKRKNLAGSVVVANGTRLESFGIAKQNTGICALENGRCTLQYRGDNLFWGRRKTSLKVKLSCDQTQEGKTGSMRRHYVNSSLVLFETVLYSKHACPSRSLPRPLQRPHEIPSVSSAGSGHSSTRPRLGLSMGSTLLVIVCALALVCIIVGALFKKNVRQTAEENEDLSNSSFWTDTTRLIKDGGTNAFDKVKKLCPRRSRVSGGYTSI